VADEHVELLEGSLVQKQLHALTRGELAQVVLAVDGALVGRLECLLTQLAEAIDAVFGALGAPGRLQL
jgi:hypothetical protein